MKHQVRIRSRYSKMRILWWGITVCYIGVNYALLGSMPALWYRIDGMLNGRGILFQYTLYSSIALVLIVFLYRHRFLDNGRNLLFCCVFILLFCLMFYLEKNPGEKIHMFQYGVFGLLLFRPLSMDLPGASLRLCITGSVICLAAGAIDEIIQGILPNRTFTWHDVFINGLSGILVLTFIYYYLRNTAGTVNE